MNEHFKILRITRNNILDAISGLSEEQLNQIPKGYNNNVIWNVAHNITTLQLLVYRLSNCETRISENFIDEFKKGSKPTHVYSSSEISEIKQLLIQTIDWLEEDYKNGVFNNYNEYTTSYNITLNSTNQAIQFNNVHESLHLGYIMAMKKLVTEYT